MRPCVFIRTVALWLALLPGLVLAQQTETFGPFELHYSVVNTTLKSTPLRGVK